MPVPFVRQRSFSINFDRLGVVPKANLFLTAVYSAAMMVLFAQPAVSQEPGTPLTPPSEAFEEAPEALLDVEIGDSEVDLFVLGYWETGINAVLARALALSGDGERWLKASFPGLTPVPYYNTIDLTLSLWLLERYYFETQVSDEFQVGSVLFGYQGMPEEPLQSVMIGNTAIGIDSYPYLGFGSPIDQAPGASVRVETDGTTHELLLRLDEAAAEQRIFVGREEVIDQSIAVTGYLRGRYFLLPDAGVTDLELYLQSATGTLLGSDGRSYRRVNLAAETVFSLEEGTVFLLERVPGKLLATYTVDGARVGSTGTGSEAFYQLDNGVPDADQPADLVFGGADVQQFLSGEPGVADDLPETAIRVQIAGNDAVVLYEPGRYSPFELPILYSSSAQPSSTSQYALAGLEAPQIAPALSVTRASFAPVLRLSLFGVDQRSFAGRYPLAAPQLATPRAELYGRAPRKLDRELLAIRIRERIPAEQIVLPADIVPGSLVVERELTDAGSYSLGEDGILALSPPRAPGEQVTIRYRSSIPGSGSDLSLAIGNRFSFGEQVEATAAVAAHWAPLAGTYSSAPGEHQGYVVTSAGFAHRGDRLRVSAAAAGAVSLSDTSGTLLLDGIDGAGIDFRISSASVYPAPRPEAELVTTGASGAVSGGVLLSEQRGELLFTDYYTDGSFGTSILQPIEFEPPESARYPYEDGSVIGPYTALAGDTAIDGQVMVSEYVIEGGDQWVGSLLRSDLRRDLSGSSELTFAWRLIDASGDVRIFLQAGAFAEDLDGDGNLDSGSSAATPQFTFDDGQVDLLVGHPSLAASSPYSEDRDGDGVVDAELPEMIITRELTAAQPGEWNHERLAFTAAERQRLSAVDGLRLIVVRDDTASASGRLLFADARVRGTDYGVTAADEATVREIPESAAGAPAFSESFPLLAERFGRDGENSLLALDWPAGGAPITLTRAVATVSSDEYRRLALYYRLADSDDAVTMRLTLRGEGGDTELEPVTLAADGRWNEYSTELPQAISFSLVQITVDSPGSGELYLDNLSLWDPTSTIGGVAEAELSWTPDTELIAGGIELLSAPSLLLRLRAESAGFPSGLAAGGPHLSTYTAVSARVLGTLVQTSASSRSTTEGNAVTVGHSLEIPLWQLTLAERFARGFLLDAGTQEQALAARLRLSGLSAAAEWETSHRMISLDQAWRASISGRIQQAEERAVAADAAIELNQESVTSELPLRQQAVGLISGYSLLLPADDTDPERTASAEAGVELHLQNTGISVDGAAEYARVDAEATEAPWAVTAAAELSVPVRLGPISARLSAGKELGLRRSLVPEASDHPFATEIAAAAGDLRETAPLLALAPVAELLLPATLQRFASSTAAYPAAEYTPSFAAEVGREIGSSVLDLVLPNQVSFTLARKLARANDSIRADRTVVADYGTVAVNLFGALGSRTVTTRFDGDEYANSLRMSASAREGAAERRLVVAGRHRARLFWSDGPRIELTGSWSSTRTDDAEGTEASSFEAGVSAEYRWYVSPSSIIGIGRLDPLIEAGARYVHTARAAAQTAFAGDKLVTSILGYRLGLEIPERGSVTLSADLGVGAEKLFGGEQSFLLGAISIGLVGRLQF